MMVFDREHAACVSRKRGFSQNLTLFRTYVWKTAKELMMIFDRDHAACFSRKRGFFKT